MGSDVEKRPPFEYCPQCKSSGPILEVDEGGVSVRRCQACGFLAEQELALESRPTDGREVKVLCVLDDVLIRESFCGILRFRGYTVFTAPDGESGLAAVSREHPDLVLLDVTTSGIDSFEVCRRLKGNPEFKQLPVIILTPVNDPKLNRRVFEAGATLPLVKTGDTAGLLGAIETALGIRGIPHGEPPAGEEPAFAVQHRAEEDLTVPVQTSTFVFRIVDGMSFEGTLSLHLNAENHPGAETILDRLNDPNLFLPLRVSGNLHVVFLNKIQIVRVDASLEEETHADPEHAAGINAQPVKVQLINGEQLQGTVRINGVSGRRRLSDHLNAHPSFLSLIGPERLHLLHKRFIVRIEPLRS